MLPRLVQRTLWWFLSMVIDGLGHLNNLSVHLFIRCPGVVEDSGVFSRWRGVEELPGEKADTGRVAAGTSIYSVQGHSSRAVEVWVQGSQWLAPSGKQEGHSF